MYWLSAVEELPVQRRWLLPGKVRHGSGFQGKDWKQRKYNYDRGSYGMDGESAFYEYHIPEADPSFTKEELFRVHL